jgi:hypothetical protein
MAEREIARRAGEPLRVRKVRRDGWTRKRREAFLAYLAATANATASARAVRITASAAHNEKRRNPAFAAAWEEALATSQETIRTLYMATVLGTATLEQAQLSEPEEGEDYPEPPDPTGFDPVLAMEFLRQIEGSRAAGTGGTRRATIASKAELADALIKRIAAVRKRRARAAAVAQRDQAGGTPEAPETPETGEAPQTGETEAPQTGETGEEAGADERG